MAITIQPERISALEYIDFLKTTDLGKQYPCERFETRIEKLVQTASISLIARDEAGAIAGVLFGLTDFDYWLFVTDLGVRRDCQRMGLGARLMRKPTRSPAAKKISTFISPRTTMRLRSMKSSA